jgi:hypothetical protein
VVNGVQKARGTARKVHTNLLAMLRVAAKLLQSLVPSEGLEPPTFGLQTRQACSVMARKREFSGGVRPRWRACSRSVRGSRFTTNPRAMVVLEWAT